MFSGSLALGRFQELFRKDWVLAILIMLLAVETTILIVIAVEWSLGNQNFPPVSIIPPLQPQCSALTPHPSATSAFTPTTFLRALCVSC